jgi:p-hydroxybenzoic acid efflux pump subunit AaeA
LDTKKYSKQIFKVAITLTLTAIAIVLVSLLWQHYMDAPWTRDGRVRADVVNVAADVAGQVTEVAVRDNQFVQQGDVLFRIDDARYRHALAEAEARVEQSKLALDMKRAQAARRARLDDQVISQEKREDSGAIAAVARAEHAAALAALEQAKLNLERTVVRSPVTGWIANLLVRPGDFAQVGAARLAVIDQHSFWVYGYFEENKLRYIKVGDAAEIHLLGADRMLTGHIESIARGIADRDNPTDVRLLANVNPNFSWVRLAQRVPVRIQLDAIPDDLTLVAGMTCTVVVKPEKRKD